LVRTACLTKRYGRSGDRPEVGDHPERRQRRRPAITAIKHLNLPPLGQPTRDMPLLTRTLLFVSQGDPIMIRTPPGGGNNGNRIRAYDKKTGAVIWDFKLPAGTTGAIMTYLHKGKQYIVAPIGSTNYPAEFVAFSLP
jgi:quinoprotein glucose dehydrogenase